jgi:DNA-binding transcriptional LysR family regulator
MSWTGGLFVGLGIYRVVKQHPFDFQMNDRLQELVVFVRVGEAGNFTRAARDMNLSQPSVSRIIGDLEARLGVKLLLRTTRRLTLTAAGAQFLERVRDILAELDNTEDAARGVDSLRGTIRLALPVVFGTREVIPHLPEFLARHPLLRVELRVSDLYQDLIAEGVDVAIRLGRARERSRPCRGSLSPRQPTWRREARREPPRT